MAGDLCTDLRRASTGQPDHYESVIKDQQHHVGGQNSPWLVAAEQLIHFPTKRLVMMQPSDWQELSAVLQSINKLCSTGKGNTPVFAYTLELLLRLGQVTSCLLCVNGDDKCFSIARVAQAIRTTTMVLQAAIQQATPAGVPTEVADSLARQRCEQTPLLSALSWALRQEARALFFNPRPTALSLATALLDLFRVVEQLWPEGIFIPQHHEQTLDAAAARMADPASQLAVAMLRCAGRALAEVGPGACKESLLCGLRVAYDLVAQLSILLDLGLQPSHEQLVKQLQQSPSMLQLMLALLAIETQRLHQQFGITDQDSCILLQPKKRQQQQQDDADAVTTAGAADAADSGRKQQQVPNQVPSQQPDTSLQRQPSKLQKRTSNADGAAEPPQTQQRSLAQLKLTPSQQQLLQQRKQQQEEEEHQEIEGAGELHQVWHQVLGMARKHQERPDDDQQQLSDQQEEVTRPPLQQLWASLGLPEGLLQLAADAGVAKSAPAQQYAAVCRVGKFLLQGSPLLQPQHRHSHDLPPAAAAARAAGASAQASPFASAAAAAGASLAPWAPSSPGRFDGAAAVASGASITVSKAGLMSLRSLSPRDYRPAAALSLTAETAEQLIESCRDYGLRGQEEIEVLRLQRVVPVVLLDTAASLLQHSAAQLPSQAAAAAAAFVQGQHRTAAREAATGDDALSTAAYQVPSAEELRVVHAACVAAACVSRCWPVLQKVTAQQHDLSDVLAECQPPAGVFAGLSTVYWQAYQLPTEVRLPMLELLQLVVKLIWQLQPPRQQQRPTLAHQPDTPLPSTQQQEQEQQPPSSSSQIVLSKTAGECLDSLLEVLTAVAKLPWEAERVDGTDNDGPASLDDDSSSCSGSQHSGQDADRRLVGEAWATMCKPVAAAVEACLRTAGQVAAAAAAAEESSTASHTSTERTAAAAAVTEATAGAGPKRHPSAVALGSCLAALCAPFGRPGPLVAAAAAAAPGGPEQHQLFALLISKVKVLMFNPGSKKASLIAMHPIEQTPIYIIHTLSSAAAGALHDPSAAAAAHPSPAAANGATAAATAAAKNNPMVPWLLLLSRMMVLRGMLLKHLLAHEADETGRSGATSTLHHAYWHVKMAEEAAAVLAAHQDTFTSSSSSSQQQQQLGLELLPALKQAVQMFKAAMKLSRHYHETGFASGFGAGFAAGYAAAVAALGGSVPASATAAAVPAPVTFASPWGVLQQGCIRSLPQQLESVGAGLGRRLQHSGCCNPLCLNVDLGSELWLVDSSSRSNRSSKCHVDSICAAQGGPCGSGRALCAECSAASTALAHKT